MKGSYSLHLFIVGHLFMINLDQSAGSPKFKIEIVECVMTAMNPTYAIAEGPQLPENLDELEKLRIAAKDYVSASWPKPDEGPTPLEGSTKGRIYYPKNQSPSSWIYTLNLKTKPEIWLRATESNNEFVIMIDRETLEVDSTDEYTFHVDVITLSPAQRSNVGINGALNEDLKSQTIFGTLSFLKCLRICIKAMYQVDTLADSGEVIVNTVNWKTTAMESSDVNHHLWKLFLYNYETAQPEEHIAFKCPFRPTVYVYSKASSTPTVMLNILIVGNMNH